MAPVRRPAAPGPSRAQRAGTSPYPRHPAWSRPPVRTAPEAFRDYAPQSHWSLLSTFHANRAPERPKHPGKAHFSREMSARSAARSWGHGLGGKVWGAWSRDAGACHAGRMADVLTTREVRVTLAGDAAAGLRERLRRTRLLPADGDGWERGVPRSWLAALLDDWE